jgi:hypothetical protein
MPKRSSLACLAFLLAAGALPAAAAAQGQDDTGAGEPVDAEIVLAVDASRSMDLDELRVQRDGYLAALDHPDLIRAITAGRLRKVAIAYVEWAGEIRDGALVPWRIIETPEDAAALSAEIAATPVVRGRGTSISRAIAFSSALLDDGSVDGARQVIDISGDGANNSGPPVVEARDAAVARGITVNGLPVMTAPGGSMAELDRYYEECVIGGLGAFVMVAHGWEDFADTLRRKLIMEISGIAPEPRVVPAQYEPMDCLIGEKTFRWRFNR